MLVLSVNVYAMYIIICVILLVRPPYIKKHIYVLININIKYKINIKIKTFSFSFMKAGKLNQLFF